MGKNIVALVLVLALIVGGTILFERQSRKKQEAELLAEQDREMEEWMRNGGGA